MGGDVPDFGHDEPDGDEMGDEPNFGHGEPDGDEMGDEPEFGDDDEHKPAMGQPIEKEMNMPLPDMGHENMEMPMKGEESSEWKFSKASKKSTLNKKVKASKDDWIAAYESVMDGEESCRNCDNILNYDEASSDAVCSQCGHHESLDTIAGDRMGDRMDTAYDQMKDSGMSFSNKKNNNVRSANRIVFTNANQINAEAIEKALASGNKTLANTILAARKANRVRMAKTLEAKIASGTPNRVAQMSADSFGKYDLDTLGFMAKSFGGNVPPALKSAIANKKGKNMKLSFTDPTKFTQAQRASFTKIAMELGMPSEYVSAMCEPILSPKVSQLNSEITAIHASTVSASTKTSLIKTLVKEAKLSADSKSEFINYWNNILGYQDKSFYPAVAADYDDGKKVK